MRVTANPFAKSITIDLSIQEAQMLRAILDEYYGEFICATSACNLQLADELSEILSTSINVLAKIIK